MIRTVIHFVEGKSFGGTEQAVLQLLSGLDRSRWRLVLFHRPEPGLAPMLESARALGIQTRVIPWMKNARFPIQLAQFAQAIRAEEAEVFHAHLHWPTACKGGLLAAALARVPAVIATSHLFPEYPWTRRLLFQQHLIERRIQRYIAVSGGVAKELQKAFKVPGKKIDIVHNAIDPARFDRPANTALRAQLTQGRHRPIVLTMARLSWQKGQTYLLEAAAHIPDALFVLAGEGEDRAMLQATVNKLGITDRVLFLGQREDIPDLLAVCDLFVLPSLQEGLPLSVLEAMAAGKPVIATAIPGTDEAVVHDETGILVPPQNSAALADAIRRLVGEPQLAEQFGAAGRARVRKEFSAEVMIQRVTQVYAETISLQDNRDAGVPYIA